MPFWLLVGAVWARCAPTLPITLRGEAPAGTEQVCAGHPGLTATCARPGEDGAYQVGVELGVRARGGLLGDRCRVLYPTLSLSGTGPAAWSEEVKIRRRDVQHDGEGWWAAVE